MFGGGTRSQVVASEVEDMICDEEYIQYSKKGEPMARFVSRSVCWREWDAVLKEKG